MFYCWDVRSTHCLSRRNFAIGNRCDSGKTGYTLHPNNRQSPHRPIPILPACSLRRFGSLVATIKDGFVLHDTFHGLEIRLSEEIPFRYQNHVGIFKHRIGDHKNEFTSDPG